MYQLDFDVKLKLQRSRSSVLLHEILAKKLQRKGDEVPEKHERQKLMKLIPQWNDFAW